MPIDPSSFHLNNTADACAIWNILSSPTLHRAAAHAKVVFVCTPFVLYECLLKQRKTRDKHDDELCNRLREAQQRTTFVTYPLDLSDLQTVDVLENRKKLGKGELASIAFALKTRQAFLTDDQKARKLAREVLPGSMVQTTPHLLGWLFFTSRLSDADKDTIITEHEEMGRPLSDYFEQMYFEACRCRLMANRGGKRE